MSFWKKLLLSCAVFALVFAVSFWGAKRVSAREAFARGETQGRSEGKEQGYSEGLKEAVRRAYEEGRKAGREEDDAGTALLETKINIGKNENFRRGMEYAKAEGACQDAYELGLSDGESLAAENWGVSYWTETQKGLLHDKKILHVQLTWKGFYVGEPLSRPLEESMAEWPKATFELMLCDALRAAAPFIAPASRLGDTYCQTILEERKQRRLDLSSPKEGDGE